MGDLISREAAIKTIHEAYDNMRYREEIGRCLAESVESVLMEIPAVKPKTGRWVPHPDPENREWDVCTACGIGCKRREYGANPDGTEWEEENNYPYCPNCGSKMQR